MRLAVGDLIVRVEAPTIIYRVTSRYPRGVWRLLPFRRSGREIFVGTVGKSIAGDGSQWIKLEDRAP